MTRGDVVTVAVQGDYGKPRPALIIQADHFHDHSSVTLLPITSTVVAAPLLRVSVQPSASNGLLKISQVMIDKAVTVRRDKLGQRIGTLSADTMVEVDRGLAVFLGIAK
jgi:mRNA interferase MazF